MSLDREHFAETFQAAVRDLDALYCAQHEQPLIRWADGPLAGWRCPAENCAVVITVGPPG